MTSGAEHEHEEAEKLGHCHKVKTGTEENNLITNERNPVRIDTVRLSETFCFLSNQYRHARHACVKESSGVTPSHYCLPETSLEESQCVLAPLHR